MVCYWTDWKQNIGETISLLHFLQNSDFLQKKTISHHYHYLGGTHLIPALLEQRQNVSISFFQATDREHWRIAIRAFLSSIRGSHPIWLKQKPSLFFSRKHVFTHWAIAVPAVTTAWKCTVFVGTTSPSTSVWVVFTLEELEKDTELNNLMKLKRKKYTYSSVQ